MLTVTVEPLTAEAFEPFGRITDMGTGERRVHVIGAYERTAEAVEPRLWVATVQAAAALPLVIESLERHPFSAQTFMPVDDCSYLVVVCPSDSAGQPDLPRLRAFSACRGQGVTYARDVWHHGLSVLQAPARFMVSMCFTGKGGDDIFVPVAQPVRLVASGAADA